MDKKPQRERDEGLESQYADDMLNMDVISAHEVTGMVPRVPLDEADVEGYLTLFPILQQRSEVAQKHVSPEEQEKKSK